MRKHLLHFLYLLTISTSVILVLHTLYSSSFQTKAVLFDPVYPGITWVTATPAEMGMDTYRLNQAVSYAGGSGYIVRAGKLVSSWGSATTLYDLKSTTKSIGSIATALAIGDGKLSLTDFAGQKHPSFGVPPVSNTTTGWLPHITLKQLATQTAGFDKDGGYDDLLFAPGSQWFYSDGGPNWLAEITTLAFGQDLNSVLFSRVFTPIGIKSTELSWRANIYRSDTINGIKNREFGSGIKATVNAMARIGYLYLRNGRWNGQQLVPESYIQQARKPQVEVIGLPEHNTSIGYNASDHYGLLWWNNGDGTLANVPRDAYWSWGLYDSLIIVIPSLDIVAVRAGTSTQAWQNGWVPNYSVIQPFIEPIVQSVFENSSPTPAPTLTPQPSATPGQGSVIEIFAAPKGTPKMELRINDQTVITYASISGNYSSRTFTKYSYISQEPVTAAQIKVAFVNDSALNDLYVDKITIDGVAYESEAPTTFSTGVYTAGKCQSSGGYFKTERLACNGYFQYARISDASPAPVVSPTPVPTTLPSPSSTPQASADGSAIDIYAAPNGTPRMELRINDQTVHAYDVSGGNISTRSFVKYTFASQNPVTIGQIKIVFTNDSAANDLYVDRIVVDGSTYQSEAPDTYSTGVYTLGKCQLGGGYFQKEKLACNGYFRYAQ